MVSKGKIFHRLAVFLPLWWILISVWIKSIIEIQCDINKSFDHLITVTIDIVEKGEIQIRSTFFLIDNTENKWKVFKSKLEFGSKEVFPKKKIKTFYWNWKKQWRNKNNHAYILRNAIINDKILEKCEIPKCLFFYVTDERTINLSFSHI